jgi:hypothetical protein
MYPADKEPDHKRAFAAAEEAWWQWSKSPSGDPDDPDRGHQLLEEFVYTARAYCLFVERQTARLIHQAKLADTNEAASTDALRSGDAVAIPGFLRRLAD